MYILFVNEERTEKVELDERGAWLAVRDDSGDTWGPPRLIEAETFEAKLMVGALLPRGRNRFVLSVDIEMTHPLVGDSAVAAAELVAHDVGRFLKDAAWGFGSAHVEAVYAPKPQFAHGDYIPAGEEPS